MRSLTQGDAQTDTYCCNRQPLSKPVSGALPTPALGNTFRILRLVQVAEAWGRGFVALGSTEVR